MLSHGSFEFESETFVKTNRCFIVGIDLEFEACEVQPVICEVEDRAHQDRSHTFALPFLVYANPDRACVFATWTIGERVDVNHANHTFVDYCHQVMRTLRVLSYPASPV